MRIPKFKRKSQGAGRIGIALGECHIALVYAHDGVIKRCLQRALPQESASALCENLQALIEELAIENIPCSVVLSPAYYQLLLAEVPPVAEEEMAAALPWRIKDLLHHPLTEVLVDYFLLPEDAYRGRQKMLYAVAAKKVELTQWASLLEGLNVGLDSIDISELVVNNLMQSLASQAANVAVLCLNGKRGYMTVSQNQAMYLSRSIDIGLQAIISTLPDDIEQFSGGQHLDNLLLEMQRSLDYYESQLGKGAVSDLYVVPLGDCHERLVKFLDQNLAARVHSLDLNDVFESEELLDMQTQHNCFEAAAATLWQPQADGV